MEQRKIFSASIKLTKGKHALVDPDDWIWLNRKNWRAKKGIGGWYALKIYSRKGKRRYSYMHRLLTNCPKHLEVHHIDGNTLNNQKENLEIMTPGYHKEIHKILRIARKKQSVPPGH